MGIFLYLDDNDRYMYFCYGCLGNNQHDYREWLLMAIDLCCIMFGIFMLATILAIAACMRSSQISKIKGRVTNGRVL